MSESPSSLDRAQQNVNDRTHVGADTYRHAHNIDPRAKQCGAQETTLHQLRATIATLRTENASLRTTNESLRCANACHIAQTKSHRSSKPERARNALHVLVEISQLELCIDGDWWHELEVRLRAVDEKAPLEHGINGCRARVRDMFAAQWVMRRLTQRMRLRRRTSEYDPYHARKPEEDWTGVSSTWGADCAAMDIYIFMMMEEFTAQT